MSDIWQPDFMHTHPIFAQFDYLSAVLNGQTFPEALHFSQLAKQLNICNSQGNLLQFMSSYDINDNHLYYEERIQQQALVSHRENNWHDFFNALIWLQFPKTKAQISHSHCQQLAIQINKQRNQLRDTLTHLDESGMILVSDSNELIQALQQHNWHHAFLTLRSQWNNTHIFTFGHGLLEKALAPYVGFTAKCLYLTQPIDWPCEHQQQVSYLDNYIATRIAEQAVMKADLYPLPILGIPNWWEANRQAIFYDNPRYFRPKRKGLT